MFPNMFDGRTSPLFIVRVRTIRPENGWVNAIYSKVFPNESSRQSSSVSKWRYPTQASMTYRCLQGMCCQWRQGSPSTLCARTFYFLTTGVVHLLPGFGTVGVKKLCEGGTTHRGQGSSQQELSRQQASRDKTKARWVRRRNDPFPPTLKIEPCQYQSL